MTHRNVCQVKGIENSVGIRCFNIGIDFLQYYFKFEVNNTENHQKFLILEIFHHVSQSSNTKGILEFILLAQNINYYFIFRNTNIVMT